MKLEIRKAVREALPIQLAFIGPTGSGKTFSALKLAAGMAKRKRVCIIDTERGRASIYSDNKKILADLPNGYDVVHLGPPYHPERCIEAIDLVESADYDVCLFDSGSDTWDGPGGCTDIAEKAKNMWNGAKLWNKRMMTRVSNSNMHFIWCLKAQEKTKIIDKSKSVTGKQEYIDLGMQPIWEKNNLFPQLMVFVVDPDTHISTARKCTDDLIEVFAKPHLITKADGEAIIRWNEGGAVVDPKVQLTRQAEAAALQGVNVYAEFFKKLPPGQKKFLIDTTHEANKSQAAQVDAEDVSEDAIIEVTPIDQLRGRIFKMADSIGDKAWAEVMKTWGKSSPMEVADELKLQDILDAMRERQKSAAA